jgi:hypothetical protein
MILYFLLGSAIPLILFISEFYSAVPSSKLLPKDEYHKFIFDVITGYSPLFLYAIIIGFLLPYFLIPAYAYFKTVQFNDRINKTKKGIIKVALGISIVVGFSDFFGGEPAIWEVRPPHHESFISHFLAANNTTDKAEKINYKNGIKECLQTINHWSITRFSYIFSVIIEGFFLNLFFFMCFFYSTLRRPLRDNNETEYNKHINGLVISSLLIFGWLLLRAMNSTEKTKLYPDADLQVANIAIGILNILCLVIVTLCTLTNSRIRKAAESLIAIASALGISVGSVVGYINPNILVLFFGRNAAIINYIVFPIVVLLMYFSYLIIDMSKQYVQEYEILHPSPVNEE